MVPGEIRLPHITLLRFDCRHVEDWSIAVPVRSHWRLYWHLTPGAWLETLDGKRLELNRQVVVVVPPLTAVNSGWEQPFDTLFLHFSLDMPYDALHGHVYQQAVDGELDGLLSQAVGWLRGKARKTPPEAWQGVFLASLIMRCLGGIPPEHWPRHVRDQRIERLIDWSETHPGRTLDNTEMAKMVGLSRTAFIRLFREVIGQTPQSWLHSRRLQHACHLLESTDKTIDGIAAACGFCDRHHFSRMFRREYFLGPATYRRSHRHG